MVEIINQYIAFLEEMETLNLNIASEYLVMSAELLEIKSNCPTKNRIKQNKVLEKKM